MTEQENNRTIQQEPSNGPQAKGPGEGEPLVQVIHAIADRVDPLLEYLKAFFERSLKAQQATAKFRIRMAWLTLSVVALVVIASGILTYLDKIDGSTFTFLLGLVVGYVLTFVRDTIKPSQE